MMLPARVVEVTVDGRSADVSGDQRASRVLPRRGLGAPVAGRCGACTVTPALVGEQRRPADVLERGGLEAQGRGAAGRG